MLIAIENYPFYALALATTVLHPDGKLNGVLRPGVQCSPYDLQVSAKIVERRVWSYEGMIMALIRQADSYNRVALKVSYPALWEEFWQRYHAPGGELASDAK